MTAEGPSLVLSGPFTDNLKNTSIWISWTIYNCKNKPSGGIKLQKLKTDTIIKNALNIFKSEAEKERLEFNDLIKKLDDIKDL
jgi:hypothetical protein